MATEIIVRAFTKEGYHADILIASDRQVHQHNLKVKSPEHSIMTGLIGHGGAIYPSDFPEISHFEVVIRESK